ncbi:Ribosomal RNA-processing protein 7 [Lachnellula cervina]|uniref:Ribosomal RNA-processing protein 7 n=1 Tax=Lachnellula cervina TaxID=1316786 RepID=A0A7D8Z416_9HELO|nr:Ribosomal RNA-processing protein 7 [Lachnellula cervina]
MAPQETSTISNFTILPILLPPSPALSHPTKTTHTLYIRPNNPKIPTEADARSVFVVNVPVDATVAHLKGVFAHLSGGVVGRVEDVIFEDQSPIPSKNRTAIVDRKRKREEEQEDLAQSQELPCTWDRETRKSGGNAVVVFVDGRSMEGVLKSVRKLHKSKAYPLWGHGISSKVPALGSSRYAAHHALRYPDPRTLQRNVDAYMTAFNAGEMQRQREAKRLRNVPDEDGFVTVTKGGRVGPAKAEEAERMRAEAEERAKVRTGEGFYRFQVREMRKVEQGELVRQFEEDKKRVEGMRERRGRGGFRPET